MLWLIWIALMLAVPAIAGIGMWLELRREQPSEPVSTQSALPIDPVAAD
jgi:hypothetical protein